MKAQTQIKEKAGSNPMREIRIEKVTLNIGLGSDIGDRMERAKKLLEILTGQKVTVTKSKTRSTFGVTKGRPIGVKITLRGEKAQVFLTKALKAKDSKIAERAFDNTGNVAFGVHEHIDLPDVKYDPSIGIFGMDVCVTLMRPGFSVKHKRLPSVIGKAHRIPKADAMEFMKQKFGVKIE